jgi:hypothetical protein
LEGLLQVSGGNMAAFVKYFPQSFFIHHISVLEAALVRGIPGIHFAEQFLHNTPVSPEKGTTTSG